MADRVDPFSGATSPGAGVFPRDEGVATGRQPSRIVPLPDDDDEDLSGLQPPERQTGAAAALPTAPAQPLATATTSPEKTLFFRLFSVEKDPGTYDANDPNCNLHRNDPRNPKYTSTRLLVFGDSLFSLLFRNKVKTLTPEQWQKISELFETFIIQTTKHFQPASLQGKTQKEIFEYLQENLPENETPLITNLFEENYPQIHIYFSLKDTKKKHHITQTDIFSGAAHSKTLDDMFTTLLAIKSFIDHGKSSFGIETFSTPHTLSPLHYKITYPFVALLNALSGGAVNYTDPSQQINLPKTLNTGLEFMKTIPKRLKKRRSGTPPPGTLTAPATTTAPIIPDQAQQAPLTVVVDGEEFHPALVDPAGPSPI